MVLERAEFAAARGARVIARLAGTGTTADAHDIVLPEPTGAGASRAIRMALADGGLSAADVSHVNAHATSTPAGDIAESAAIRSAIGDHAVIAATKSQTGHMMGASGAIEAIFAVLALRDQVVPFVRNLDDLDPNEHIQALDIARNEPRRMQIDAVISDSFGFGGHNVALLLTRP